MKKLSILSAVLITLSLFVAPVSAQSVKYEYDALNRLTTATYADGTTVSYTYDAAGNRLSEVVKKPSLTVHVWTKRFRTFLGIDRFEYSTEVAGWTCAVSVFPGTGDIMLVSQLVGTVVINSANVTMIQDGKADSRDKRVFSDHCIEATATLHAEARDKIMDYLTGKK